jgi:hypothetical protein
MRVRLGKRGSCGRVPFRTCRGFLCLQPNWVAAVAQLVTTLPSQDASRQVLTCRGWPHGRKSGTPRPVDSIAAGRGASDTWRVVIGDRRSLTIGAGGFEAIRHKVPGLRHGQQVARGLSALVCEPSVLFCTLFVVHRFLPANRLRIGPSEIMLPSRQIAVGSTRNFGAPA